MFLIREKKAELVERTKYFRESSTESKDEEVLETETTVEDAPAEEPETEDAPAEEQPVEESTETTSSEEAPVEEISSADKVSSGEEMEVEKDGPLEDWTVKDLKDERKTLGLLDRGKRLNLLSISKNIGQLKRHQLMTLQLRINNLRKHQ